MVKYLMALDQGTTSSRCLIFDPDGAIRSSAQLEFSQHYPRPGWVEHDPTEIWSSQSAVMAEAMAKLGAGAGQIAALGISNQRETVILWDKRTGKPVHNAIVWQCRRTADYCDQLRARGLEQTIKEKTGLVLDAYFSATKLHWLLENVAGARQAAEAGHLLFGTVDTWLIWNLTRGAVHVTDYSNASRTMLYNIHTLQWDAELLREMAIPASVLPKVVPSSGVVGTVAADLPGGGIPIAGLAGDQQAALFGQCCHEPGMVKNTYGTGCFILMHTGDKAVDSKNGLLSTIAWGLGEGKVEYALEGSVFVAGAVVQWLRDGIRIIDSAADTEALATSVEDTAGVYVVPAFVGLGAPYWDPHARGLVVGLTRGVPREHLVRASLEAMAFQSADVIRAMEADCGVGLKTVRVDGGAAINNFLMQFQADMLDTDIIRPALIESTAIGAAYLAGLACGYYQDLDHICRAGGFDRVFKPNMAIPVRERLLAGWKDAVSRSLG
ncbi:MAG: glycerol kinase GlpK, partial [Planctomycetes bacterium]|nr:glycerol kinase GlpK [Planctomycetota bacterium]